MIAMSREPSPDHKIQFPSIAELKDGFTALTNRLARRMKFRGRKMRVGSHMNAILVHYMSLPEAEQIAIVEQGMRRYEALLESDSPVDDFGSVQPDGALSNKGIVGLGVSVRKTPAKPKRKDKSAKTD